MKKLKISYLIITIMVLSFVAIPIVFASGETKISVPAGTTSLKEAVANAKDGDYLELNGDYGQVTTATNKENNTITIDKDITICGRSMTSTKVYHLFNIVAKPNGEAPTVKLCNFMTESVNKQTNQVVFNINSKANVTLENLSIQYIWRAVDEVTRVGLIDVIKDENGDASGSTITLNNAKILTSYDTVYFKDVSNVTMNITGEPFDFSNSYSSTSAVEGLYAFKLENGQDNKIDIKNTSIRGRSNLQKWDEVISIVNQQNLTINIEDSLIRGVNPSDKDADMNSGEYLISFDSLQEGANSTNVKINITGNSKIIDQNNREGSAAFNLGNSNAPTSNNVITLGKDVILEENADSPIAFAKKYNTNVNYAVVGIKDKDGRTTIKAYPKNQPLPGSDLVYPERYEENSKTYKFHNLNYIDETGIGEFAKESLINRNMDIYPTYGASITVDVTNLAGEKKSYDVFELDTFKDFTAMYKEALEYLEELKDNNKTNKQFHYFVDNDGEEITENYVFHKNTEIKPVYQIKITIKNEEGLVKELLLDENHSLDEATGDLKEYLDALKNDKYFSRFTLEDGSNFDTKTILKEDITLKIKRNAKVTIDNKDYYIEIGKTLNELATELKTLENATNKQFKEYYDKTNNWVVTLETEIDKDMEIMARFTIKVTIKDGSETVREITLDENQTLENANQVDKEYLNTLETDKYFSRFTLEDGSNFDIKTNLKENTTLSIKRNAKVTIDGKDYYVEIGKTLNELATELKTLENATNKQFKEYYDKTNKRVVTLETEIDKDMEIEANFTVKVVLKNDGRVVRTIVLDYGQTLMQASISDSAYLSALKAQTNFSRLAIGDTTFDFTTPVTENLEVDVKYNVKVTIDNKVYPLEKGKTLNDLATELKVLENATNKSFKEYYDKTNKQVVTLETKVDKDMEIIANFTVKVTLKDENQEVKVFILDENQTLNDLTLEDKNYLDTLKNDKHFSRFILGDATFKLDTPITENIELIIKKNVIITINDEDYYLEKGEQLAASSKIVEVLENLKGLTNKQFKEFYNIATGEVISNPLTLVANEDMKLGVNYTIEITIDDTKYTLDEGQTLNDLADEVVNSLKEMMNQEHFERFALSDDSTVDLDTKLYENATITAKYDILVTIGSEKFVLEEGQSLSDLTGDAKERLDALKTTTSPDKKFAGYKDLATGKIITDKTPITANINLEIIFEYVEVPKTLDNIYMYIGIAIVSFIVIISGVVYLKKYHN